MNPSTGSLSLEISCLQFHEISTIFNFQTPGACTDISSLVTEKINV